MTKDEFTMEAALRLIVAKPQADMLMIADMAKDLAERITNRIGYNTQECAMQEDMDTVSVIPVFNYLDSHRYNSTKLTRIFYENDIKTVGDLLRVGSYVLKKYRGVGLGTFNRICDALDELYGIKEW